MKAKRTATFGGNRVAEYCGRCLRRVNRGLRANGAPEFDVQPCMRGQHFACFGCGYLFDGTVVTKEVK